jgi:hypothetical protein
MTTTLTVDVYVEGIGVTNTTQHTVEASSEAELIAACERIGREYAESATYSIDTDSPCYGESVSEGVRIYCDAEDAETLGVEPERTYPDGSALIYDGVYTVEAPEPATLTSGWQVQAFGTDDSPICETEAEAWSRWLSGVEPYERGSYIAAHSARIVWVGNAD